MTDKPAWVEGDPLMEAMAAAVWEQCRTEPMSVVVDDPRNIAAVAASVARAHAPGIGYEFRESLLVLLSRVQRGVQSTSEADLLRSHVEHLLAEHDRLAALNEPEEPTP